MPKLYDVFHEMHDTVFEYQVVAAAVVRYQADVQAAMATLPRGKGYGAAPPRRRLSIHLAKLPPEWPSVGDDE
jgi:hypothetical protein